MHAGHAIAKQVAPANSEAASLNLYRQPKIPQGPDCLRATALHLALLYKDCLVQALHHVYMITRRYDIYCMNLKVLLQGLTSSSA